MFKSLETEVYSIWMHDIEYNIEEPRCKEEDPTTCQEMMYIAFGDLMLDPIPIEYYHFIIHFIHFQDCVDCQAGTLNIMLISLSKIDIKP